MNFRYGCCSAYILLLHRVRKPITSATIAFKLSVLNLILQAELERLLAWLVWKRENPRENHTHGSITKSYCHSHFKQFEFSVSGSQSIFLFEIYFVYGTVDTHSRSRFVYYEYISLNSFFTSILIHTHFHNFRIYFKMVCFYYAWKMMLLFCESTTQKRKGYFSTFFGVVVVVAFITTTKMWHPVV